MSSSDDDSSTQRKRRRRKKRKSAKEDYRSKHRKSQKRKKRRRRREHHSSSDDDSCSSSQASYAPKRHRKRRRKSKKRSEVRTSAVDTIKHAKDPPASTLSHQNASTPTAPSSEQQAKVASVRPSMKPMTQEEWRRKHQEVREVYDEETGRVRLMRGTGEIIERIVSSEAHSRINKGATRGDGDSFSRHVFAAAKKKV